MNEIKFKLSDKDLKLITANNELENLYEAIGRGDSCKIEMDFPYKYVENRLECYINNILKSTGYEDIINLKVNLLRKIYR